MHAKHTLVLLTKRLFNVDAAYFISGGFWLLLSQLIVVVFGIATSALLAHYLTEVDYGIYRFILGLAAILSVFSLTGLGQSILQTAAKKYIGFYTDTITTNFFYSLGITILGLSTSLYYFLNDNLILSTGCLLIAIFQPFITTFQNVPVLLQGKRRFREATTVQAIKTIFVSVVSIITLWLTQNILILVFTYLICNALSNFITHICYRPKSTNKIDDAIARKYLNYAKHTSVRNIISGVAFRLDTIIVFTQLGAAPLALYSIANIIPEQINAALKNLTTLLLPKYAKYGDIVTIKKHVPKRSIQFLLLIILITGLYIFMAPILYTILFPKYESAILLSQIAILSLPSLVAIIPMTALQSQLKERELYAFNIQSSIILILLTLILTSSHGLIGAFVAKITSRYINVLLAYFHLLKAT